MPRGAAGHGGQGKLGAGGVGGHVRFAPTRQALLVLSSKRREVLGESHEG